MPKLPDGASLSTREQVLIEEIHKVRSLYPWVWCIEFKDADIINDIPQYLVSNTEMINWDGKDFLVFPFHIDRIPTTSTGQFPSTNLVTFNTYELVQTIERHNGFVGANVVLYILNTKILKQFSNDPSMTTDLFNLTDYPYKFPFKIKNTTISGSTISFNLGAPNYMLNKIPAKQYVRDFCNFTFKGEHCWMKGIADEVLTADAKLSTSFLSDPKYLDCQKTYQFCKMYWRSATLSEAQDLIPYNIPKGIPYGGFPTVAKGDLNYY